MRKIPSARAGLIPFELNFDTLPLPPPGGAVKRRLAVRSVIVRGGLILLIRSKVNCDWKFPGGGVEAGEDPARALVREIQEETGYRTPGDFRPLGTAWERSAGRDIPGSVFIAESRYFRASVTGEQGPLLLDDYEQKLEFAPAWVPLAQALAENKALAGPGNRHQPPWLNRETAVMDLLVREPGFLV